MNFDMTDLKLRLRDFLAEPVAAFWSDVELEDIINEIQRDIAHTACCYQKIDTPIVTEANVRTVPGLQDAYRIAAMEYFPSTGYSYALRKILPRQIGHVADATDLTPQCWMEYGATAGIDPLPASAHALAAYLCSPAPGISPAPNLRPGGNPSCIATDSFIFVFPGTLEEIIATEEGDMIITEAGHALVTYSISESIKAIANLTGTAPAGAVVPIGRYGAWRLEISSDEVIDAIPASGNASGYTSSAQALAGLPAIQADHVAVGTATVIHSADNFTPGTTSFLSAGVTATFTDDPDLAGPSQLPRQFWPLILLGAMARALGKFARSDAAVQQVYGMFLSELRLAAYDFYEQYPDTHADMRYE